MPKDSHAIRLTTVASKILFDTWLLGDTLLQGEDIVVLATLFQSSEFLREREGYSIKNLRPF